jgi:energy-coupling factor transporter ATP-binding protein EcfA2
MKIDRINVADYSRNDEYPGVETRPEGETHLLYGSNVSGKTMTFSALSHAVLHNSMQTRPGNSCSVGVEFTDESLLHRGRPKTTFETNRHDSKSENVESRMNEVLGRRPILRAYFIPSRTDQLPLSRLGIDTILDIVRSVTVPEVDDKIAEKRREASQRENERETVTAEQQKTEKDIEAIDRDIDSVEAERDAAETVVRLGNTGELETIRDALEDQDEAAVELNSLLAERDDVEEDLRTAKQRREKLREDLHEPLDRFNQSVVEDEHCPVCIKSIPESKVDNRVDDGRCPLCGLETSIDELLEPFKKDKQTAESQIDGVREEVERLTEQLDGLDEEIEAVRSDQPDLSGFDTAVRERLEAHDREVSAVVDAARDDHEAAVDTLDQLRQKRQELSTQKEELEDRQRRLDDEIEELREEVVELEGSAQEGIERFSQTWRGVLEEMTETIRRGIVITAEDGIQIGGKSDRNYGPEDLSDSEMHVLNLAFAVAVNETVKSGRAALDTIVIDDPFTNLDNDVREEVVSFILNDDNRQYVFTSSDTAIAGRVPDSQQKRLKKDDVQRTLNSYPGEDDSE